MRLPWADYLMVNNACPTCKVPAWAECVTRTGRKAGTNHAARIALHGTFVDLRLAGMTVKDARIECGRQAGVVEPVRVGAL